MSEKSRNDQGIVVSGAGYEAKRREELLQSRDYATIREELLQSSPEARQSLADSSAKRRIALMLALMRSKREMSQKEVANCVGWDKAYVSRLEGALGGIPDIQTLVRFAEACGMSLGLFVVDKDDVEDENLMYIVDAVALSFDEVQKDGSKGAFNLDFLRGRRLHYPRETDDK